MNNPHQTIQDTKSGFSNSLSKKADTTKDNGPTRDELNQFLESVDIATANNTSKGIPVVEASRKIVEFYNRSNLSGFDDVGYFLFKGVKVFELGKRAEAERRDGMSIEEKVFGK